MSKHKSLTQSKLYDHWATIRDCETAARQSLDCVSDTVNATDGSITDENRYQLRAQAKRTAAQCLALVEAIDAKLGIEGA